MCGAHEWMLAANLAFEMPFGLTSLLVPSRLPRNLRRNDLVNVPVGFFDGFDALT